MGLVLYIKAVFKETRLRGCFSSLAGLSLLRLTQCGLTCHLLLIYGLAQPCDLPVRLEESISVPCGVGMKRRCLSSARAWLNSPGAAGLGPTSLGSDADPVSAQNLVGTGCRGRGFEGLGFHGAILPRIRGVREMGRPLRVSACAPDFPGEDTEPAGWYRQD